MCHSNRPRCQSCNARAPKHRCHCPTKTERANAMIAQQQHANTLPAYDSLGAQTASPLHGWAMQPVAPRQCGASRSCGHGCGHGCDHGRRCRGPVRMLVGYLVQKHQEKKAKGIETEGAAATFEALQQERGVVEIESEKGEAKGVEKGKSGEVKVVAKSVSSMSL